MKFDPNLYIINKRENKKLLTKIQNIYKRIIMAIFPNKYMEKKKKNILPLFSFNN